MYTMMHLNETRKLRHVTPHATAPAARGPARTGTGQSPTRQTGPDRTRPTHHKRKKKT